MTHNNPAPLLARPDDVDVTLIDTFGNHYTESLTTLFDNMTNHDGSTPVQVNIHRVAARDLADPTTIVTR